jgi:hypothetical protein
MGSVEAQLGTDFTTIAGVSLSCFTPLKTGFPCFMDNPRKWWGKLDFCGNRETRLKGLFHFCVSRVFHLVSSVFHACFTFQTPVMKHPGARSIEPGCFRVIPPFSVSSCTPALELDAVDRGTAG